MADGESPALVSVEETGRDVRLVLSDGTTLELAAESLPPALPAPGEALPSDVLAELREAAERKRVARRVFALLDRRLQTRRRLQRKLLDEGYAAGPVDTVLDRFEAEGIHSDRRFAEAWCRDTLRARPVGRRYLEAKLREQGVDAGLAADTAAASLTPEAERRAGHAAALKWWRRQRGAVDVKALSRGQRYLMGRGFPAAVAAEAVRTAAPQEQGEDA